MQRELAELEKRGRRNGCEQFGAIVSGRIDAARNRIFLKVGFFGLEDFAKRSFIGLRIHPDINIFRLEDRGHANVDGKNRRIGFAREERESCDLC